MNQNTTKRVGKVRSSNKARRSLAVAALMACGGGAPAAFAQVTWTAGTGSYVTGTNWSSGLTPSNAANEFLVISNGGTAQVSGANAAEGAFLNIGLQPGETGHLEISGGTLTLGELRLGGREAIPAGTSSTFNGGGVGTIVQSGGDVNVTFTPGSEPPIQSMYVGDGGLASGNTANGSYTISAGTLTAGITDNDSIVVGSGNGATGTMVHSGGTVTSRGFLSVGRRGSTGKYTFSGGILNVGSGSPFTANNTRNLWIGDGDSDANDNAADYLQNSNGTFTQANGVVTVGDDAIDATQNVEIGRRSGTGTYDLSGGTTSQLKILNGSLVVGGGGNVNTLAASMKGNGTLHLSGSASITIGDSTTDGNAADNGNRGNFNVGLNGGTLGSNVGTFNMDGGSVTLNDAAGIMAIGNGVGATGTVTMTAGTLTITGASSNLDVGRNAGNGTLTISGTAAVNVHQLTVNSNATASNRTVNINGGSLDADIVTFGTGVASAATRRLNITGGNVDIGFLTTGLNVGAGTSITTISGGTVNIDQLELFRTSRFKIETNNLVLDSVTTYGNATLEVAGTTTFSLIASGSLGTGTSSTLTKVGSGTFTVNVPQNYFNNSGIAVTDGTVNYNTAIPGGLNVTGSGNSTTNFNNANSTLISLTLNTATATIGASGTLVLTTNTLAINGGRLDVRDNHLVVKTTPIGTVSGTTYDGVTGYIQSGRNGGNWSGSGIVTSLTDATVGGLTSIGVATAQQVKALANPGDTSTWAGVTVTGTDTLVMYTYGGDANLDGKVSISDYGKIDFGISIPGASGWYNGDFNYDGKVTISDYGIIDFTIGIQGSQFIAGGGLNGVSAVPEPMGLTVMALAAIVSRRRRRSS